MELSNQCQLLILWESHAPFAEEHSFTIGSSVRNFSILVTNRGPNEKKVRRRRIVFQSR
jgi:hypothetical protein